MANDIFEFGFDNKLFRVLPSEEPTGIGAVANLVSEEVDLSTLTEGDISVPVSMVETFIQSSDFETGVSGWRISADGGVEFNDGTFRGEITGSSININDVFIVATTGAATIVSATIGGWSVDDTKISSGSNGITLDSSSDEITVGNLGSITVGSGAPVVIDGNSQGIDFYTGSTINAAINLDGTDILGIKAGNTSTTPINVLFERASANTGVVRPDSGDTIDLGNSTTFWNDVSYKTLTDRGCLGWFDEGVELQDGRVVSDTEALLAIKKHPTKKTVYGAPMLDYSSLPKDVYRPAVDGTGKPYKRGKNGEPLPIKQGEETIQPQDGAETTALISIMLGAIKEQAREIEKLKKKYGG